MFDTHLSYIKIICNIMPACKLSDAFTMLCRFDILIRCKMIRHQCNLIFVKNSLFIQFLNFVNCYRSCNIICQYQIQIGLDQLTCHYMIQSGMCS